MEQTWVYRLDHDSAPNFKFELDNMLQRKATDVIEAMIRIAETVITNDCFRLCMHEIMQLDRNIFKDISQSGVVFIEKRWKDLGNYQYTFLYQLLLRVARDQQNDLLPLMQALAQRYPTLAFRAKPTNSSLTMKGDVIEFVLSVARDTGPAISKEVAWSRIKFCTAMVEFARRFEDFCHIICVNEDGPPRMHYFPPPDILVKACLFAYYQIQDDQGPRNYYKEQYAILKAGIEDFQNWSYQESSGMLLPISCRC